MASPLHRSDTPTRWRIGTRLKELRSTYGAQDWLTVVGGVVGNAYRLAGMTGTEFAALLRAQTEERGRLLIHLRRKPVMRLRDGFDGRGGGILDEEGLTRANVHFSGGSYAEQEGTITTSGKFPSSLLVTGPLNRPVGLILRDVPRCIAGLRVRALRQTRWGLELDVVGTFETLAPMPAEVAAELGVENQRHLAHLPWIGYEGPAPTGSGVADRAPKRPASATIRPAAKLRLVAST